MKKIISILLLFSFFSVHSQEYKKLLLTTKGNLSKLGAIYIEPLSNDRLLLVDYFKNSLGANGFKIVIDRKEAVYLITVNYHHRNDTGCGGRVIKDMNGQIIEIKNNAEIIANFSFSQSAFEGKCTSDVISALAKRMNEKSQ
jgi:hypothetical protein